MATKIHKRTDPIARGKRMDNDAIAATAVLAPGPYANPYTIAGTSDGSYASKTAPRGGMGSCTYINSAPKAHINAMVTSCLVLHPIRVLKMDMLRLFRHKDHCLFPSGL